MTYLVAYYSRTGNNREIGEKIAEALSADIDEIIDKQDRGGKLNWMRAGRDSKEEKLTEIEYQKNPQDYDTIIIGAPMWAGKPNPPLRTYLKSVDLTGKRVAFFVCSKTKGYIELLTELESMTPEAEHIGTFGIQEKDFKAGDYESELGSFIEELRK
ncbi:MAG: flavodoxin family protein [Candidatus Thorarchaeota archaeon]|jgi:flavodoxin